VEDCSAHQLDHGVETACALDLVVAVVAAATFHGVAAAVSSYKEVRGVDTAVEDSGAALAEQALSKIKRRRRDPFANVRLFPDSEGIADIHQPPLGTIYGHAI
jgi:hypothetical protein